MRRGTRIAVGVAGGLLVLVVLAGVAMLVITQTDWGRERVRTFAEKALNERAHGRVSIGRASGNLLTGITLDSVEIVDSTGAPFFRAERVSTRYSLRALLSERIVLTNVRLIRPVVVLDRRPGADWNFVRIFPTDTTARDTTARGLGSWIVLDDVQVVQGHVRIRNEWAPDDSLSAAERARAIREALAGETRLRVVQVPGGYQTLMDFRELDARLPHLRLADPDSADILVQVATARTRAELFQPPGTADVRDLAGTFRIGEDSLHFADLRVALPATRLAGEGAYVFGSGDLRARAEGDPIALADLRWLYPPLPEDGGGRLALVAAMQGGTTSVAVNGLELRLGEGTLTGHLGLTLGDTLQLRDTDLRFAHLDTRLIERLAPAVEIPRHGTLDGHVRLAGNPSALRVDGEVAFVDPRSGTSRVRAVGEVGTGEEIRMRHLRVAFDPVRLDLVRAFVPDLPLAGTLNGRATLDGAYPGLVSVDGDLTLHDPRSGTSRVLAAGGVSTGEELAFRDLRLRFEPVQVALARLAVPDLPVGGTVSGNATLNGSPDGRLAATADLVHQDRGERSHLVGSGALVNGATPRFDADVRLLPLSLVTVGRFAPAAELQGTLSGRVRAAGSLRDLRLRADVRSPQAGALAAEGRFDLESAEKRYDFTARLDHFDAGGLTARAPRTSLTGVVSADGRGIDPATMRATLAADLTGPAVDTVRLDSVRLAAAVGGGVVTVQRAVVRLASAELDAHGSLGLAPGRGGELEYRLEVDSLSDFARYLPSDTGVVTPRPSQQAIAVERARADSLRFARETEVERLATGRPALPALRVDSVRPIRRDSVAGRLLVQGRVQGNLEDFDLEGEAQVQGLVVLGNAVGEGRVRYALAGFGTPASRIEAEVALDSVRAAGFALDSVAAGLQYRGDFEAPDRGGTVDVRVFESERRDYRARADFALALDRGELRLEEAMLRFDTLRWTSTGPGVVSWGGGGVGVDHLELRGSDGGRIYVDGDLPAEGPIDLDLVLDRVQVGNIVELLQGDEEATGLVSLAARLTGTQASPLLRGDLAVREASYQGRGLPAVDAAFDYADTELSADARLLQEGRALLTAEARLPIDLALAGQTGDRLPQRPLAVDVRMDSLPLDALPSFTDAVEEVQGRVVGSASVRGTYDDPELSGQVALDLGRFRIVPLGVTFTDIAGALRLQGDSVRIDSLVAHSGGTLRVTGGLGVAELTEPGFALRVAADDALVLDNDMGRVYADARLAIDGPYDRVAITGDVGVERGVIYIPESQGSLVDLSDPAVTQVADTAALEARELLPARNPLLDNLQVNLSLAIAHDTWVRSSAANVEIYTPEEVGPLRIEVDRRSNRLTLLGTVNADRGEYEALGKRFTLTSGTATFLGGSELNPLLHLAAEYRVQIPGREALAIRIQVGGSLTAPTLSLSSNAQPPIAQSDLLSYLAFGRSSSSLLQQSGSGLSGPSGGSGGLVGAVGGLATKQLTGVALGALVDEFESSAGSSLGLDVFRVTPADVPSELSFGGIEGVLLGTEVEAGKYLTRRWFVAGQARPTFVRPGARIEYRTPEGFRWTLTYEPRFLPREPSFSTGQDPETTGVLGGFLRWEWRR